MTKEDSFNSKAIVTNQPCKFVVYTCSPQPGRCSTLTIVMIIMIIMIIIIIIIIIITIASSHHHIMIIITLKFATPSEQYDDWGNNINFIFMRGQNSPPPLNNMLIGVITSTLSSWGIKNRHPLWQNSPPSMNNMLVGVITSTLSA